MELYIGFIFEGNVCEDQHREIEYCYDKLSSFVESEYIVEQSKTLFCIVDKCSDDKFVFGYKVQIDQNLIELLTLLKLSSDCKLVLFRMSNLETEAVCKEIANQWCWLSKAPVNTSLVHWINDLRFENQVVWGNLEYAGKRISKTISDIRRRHGPQKMRQTSMGKKLRSIRDLQKYIRKVFMNQIEVVEF